jgi:cell fate regulator YaaT (PSP1 superfamily)
MKKVASISFKEVGKIYYFDPLDFDLKTNDRVVVETVRGLELGTVVLDMKEIEDREIEHELKPILRIATNHDLNVYNDNIERAEKALVTCKKIVRNHKLSMKLLECEFTLDRQKIIIYYNAEGRVDFRELLKELASEFKLRIELRQIGPREGAKFIGGLGPCGRETCCSKHLREFDLVTMKMAKDQGMTLNASKVGGLCGKLMCCIGYENAHYEELRSRVPLVGDLVKSPTCGCCKVISVDLLREIVRTANDDKIEVWEAKELVKIKSNQEAVKPEDLTDDIRDNGYNS